MPEVCNNLIGRAWGTCSSLELVTESSSAGPYWEKKEGWLPKGKWGAITKRGDMGQAERDAHYRDTRYLSLQSIWVPQVLILCMCVYVSVYTNVRHTHVLLVYESAVFEWSHAPVMSPTPPALEMLLRWCLRFHVSVSGSHAPCTRGHEYCYCLSFHYFLPSGTREFSHVTPALPFPCSSYLRRIGRT